MRDWKGNEVKAGDTVVRIRLQDDHSLFPTGMFLLVIGKDGSCRKENEVVLEKLKERKFLWEEIDRYEVFLETVMIGKEPYSFLARKIVIDKDAILIRPIDDPFGEKSDKVIDCIVGKSDSRDEYYLEHFRA